MAKHRNDAESYLTAVVANAAGEIFDLQGYAAVGRADGDLVTLRAGQTQPVPHGAELMYLPDRSPVVWDVRTGRLRTLTENPYRPGEPLYPVAIFNSPGYVNCYLSAYREKQGAGPLPLFSYAAAGWSDGRFYTPVVRVDTEPRQDLRRMKIEDVKAGIRRKKKQMPHNRLSRHLERCALTFGCPAGKNFFLERFEAPLPTSQACNARCRGCLSLQSDPRIPCSQNRIDFTPTVEEIAQVALAHIQSVPDAVVSFGQGCEGDPLLAAEVIVAAIGMIRSATAKGTIHMNTNGSLPDVVDRLFEAGLDSMRISLNSIRPDYYEAYFRPRGYRFQDVLASIRRTVAGKRFVSINYLNCPGFTDTQNEMNALIDFIGSTAVHMIQWRNLNYDPVRYWRQMAAVGKSGRPVGMRHLLQNIRKAFPELIYGYFNPPKARFAATGG